MRLLELVVDEYGQGEGERGRERVREREFRREVAENAALGMLLYLSNAVPSYASGKRGTSCSLLFLPFSCYGFARICWYCAAYSQVGE